MSAKKILLLLAEGFEIYEASAFVDVMGWNQISGDGSTELHTCALRKEIKSTFNQTIKVNFTLDQINPDDYTALAVPGGFEEFNFYRDAYSKEFSDLISHFNKNRKTIASICTGALPIAKSGVLNRRRGTTYNKNPLRQQALKDFGVEVVSSPIVVDENVITSWNPSTAMQVAFLLLESLTSKTNANKIRNLMGFEITGHGPDRL